jgi:nitroimidazol reductase NimA-like FMN-containing flavoprotein (pyridoxamine 5'-phosphate oxidase superfamily)
MREMRRIRQKMSEEKVEKVLERNTNGVLGVYGEDGYPYTVPLSFVYQDGAIYFHSAAEGHKIDAIRKNPKVSFTVVDEDTIVGAEYTTYFRSVIAFGTAELVTDEAERRRAFLGLMEKYCPEESEESREAVLARSGGRAALVRIRPEQMTGKEAIEYAQAAEA